MKKLVLIGILFVTSIGMNAQTVDAEYINPTTVSTTYNYLRFGTSTDYFGGVMLNHTSANYGDGDDFSLFSYDDRDITFRTGVGNLIVFPTNGGNMGIGTSDPLEDLDIARPSQNIGLRLGSTSNNYDSYLNLYEGVDNHGVRLYMDGDNNHFIIKTRLNQVDSDVLVIPYAGSAAGNVGIGTNSPTEKLTVNGNILFGDGDKTNSGESNLGLEWHTSIYGNGFGHKIYSSDNPGYTDLRFASRNNSGTWSDAMTIFSTGAIAMGTTDFTKMGTHKLAVNGSIICTELKVELETNWPDYVFGTKHNLKTLNEVEEYISENNHLPGVPSAEEVKEDGLAVGDMLKIQMEKIEELTLYMIQLKNENEFLKSEIDLLK